MFQPIRANIILLLLFFLESATSTLVSLLKKYIANREEFRFYQTIIWKSLHFKTLNCDWRDVIAMVRVRHKKTTTIYLLLHSTTKLAGFSYRYFTEAKTSTACTDRSKLLNKIVTDMKTYKQFLSVTVN